MWAGGKGGACARACLLRECVCAASRLRRAIQRRAVRRVQLARANRHLCSARSARCRWTGEADGRGRRVTLSDVHSATHPPPILSAAMCASRVGQPSAVR